MGRGFIGLQGVGIEQENFSCHVGRDRDGVRQNHVGGGENPILRTHPAQPHCHPSCSTHSFSSRSYLFNFLFPLRLFLTHMFNFFISKNARYTKIYTNFVTCCESWKCIHMVSCGKSCISFVVLAI